MYKVFLAFVVFFLTLLLHAKNVTEHFSYADDISVDTSYDIPQNNPLAEVDTCFIHNVLSKEVKKIEWTPMTPPLSNGSTSSKALPSFMSPRDPNISTLMALPANDTKIDPLLPKEKEVLYKTNGYLLFLVNRGLEEGEKRFGMVYSDMQAISVTKEAYVLANTTHVIYRERKAYGFSIKLETIHDGSNVFITGYSSPGKVFEDMIALLHSKKENKEQPFMKDGPQTSLIQHRTYAKSTQKQNKS